MDFRTQIYVDCTQIYADKFATICSPAYGRQGFAKICVKKLIQLGLIVFISYSLVSTALYAQETKPLSRNMREFRAKLQLDGKPLYLQSSVDPLYDEIKSCFVLRTISYKGDSPLESFVVYEIGIDEKDGKILFMNELKLPYAPSEAFKKASTIALDLIRNYHPNYKVSMYYWDYVKDNYRLTVFYRPEAMTIDSWYCRVEVDAKDGSIIAKSQGLYR
ncbi:MAG: hypothetical protein ABIH01_02920 [Candidatus Omnitrophota bacterium]